MKVGNEVFYVCGTAYVLENESEPKQGRILLFKYDQDNNELQLFSETLVKGAVYSVGNLKGNLVAAINNQVSVYKLNLDSDIKLVQETTKYGNVIIVHMKVYEDKILIADLMRSMSVYKYKEKEGLLEEESRDYNPNWMSACEVIDAETYIGSENFNNVFVCQRQSIRDGSDTTAYAAERMEEVAMFNVGDLINCFQRGSLVMDSVVETELKTRHSESLLYGTVTGSIGMILPIEEESFEFLSRVEKKMEQQKEGIGGLRHEKYRSFRSCRRIEESPKKNVIDGDLIESLLDLPAELKRKIVEGLTIKDGNGGKRDVTLEELVKKIEELNRLH